VNIKQQSERSEPQASNNKQQTTTAKPSRDALSGVEMSLASKHQTI